MSLTRDQMAEMAEKQEILTEMSKEYCVQILKKSHALGYGAPEFLYVLCLMVVCGGEGLGFSNAEILQGVSSLLETHPENLTTQ